MAGDDASLEWVVARFSPLLLSLARNTLGRKLRRVCDPEDLVADVWAVALPRLRGLPARSGRFTPVLMKFLATTLRFVTSNLVQKHGKRVAALESVSAAERADGDRRLDAGTRGVVSKAVQSELRGALARALDALDAEARAIVLLRGFEQLPNQEVATRLDLLPNTVAVKYRRALERLRSRLPGSVFDEFPS